MPNKVVLSLAQGTFCLLFLAACATTKHADVPVKELGDAQLVEELESVGSQLGVKINAASYLLAMRPEPAYVLASSTSFTHGTYSGTSVYSMPSGYSRNIYGTHTGSYSGTTTTNYQYYDANATARAANNLAIAINQAQINANIERGKEVVAEIQSRQRKRQQQAKEAIDRFLSEHPTMKQRQNLLAAILPWVSASKPDLKPYQKLEKAREIAVSTPDKDGIAGTWYGVFSQQATSDEGEQYNLNSFFVLSLVKKGDKIAGVGQLGTGEKIKLYGTRSGYEIDALIVNTTSGINSKMEATAAPNQITGSFEGSAAGGTWQGQFSMYQ